MRRLLLLSLATLLYAGCDCGGPVNQGTGAGGELKVTENQVEFGEACPKPSDPALQVEVVTRQVHVSNVGRAALSLNRFEVEASRADVFTFDPSQVPETLASGEEITVDLTFVPKESGSVVADLLVVGDETEAVVKLLGTGKGLPAHPTLTMSCAGGAFGDDRCAAETPNVFFSETPVDQTTEMVVQLRNGGCPALTISNLAVSTDTEYGADPATFSLAEGQPTSVTVTGGGTGELRVRFSPRASDSFDGTLSFETNDPERRQLTLALKGAGSTPTLVVETSIPCGYPDPAARPSCCDFSPKLNACTGKFTVRNSGADPLTVTAASLKSNNPLFRLEDASSLIGTEIPGFGELTDAITVTYVPGALRGTDFLQVESTGGNASAELRGGSPAFLQTFPAGLLDFNAVYGQPAFSVTTDYWAPVSVMNIHKYNQQLPLTVSQIELTQSVHAFEVSATSQSDCEATLEEGEAIPAGQSRSVCVHFKSTVNGGTFGGTLTLQTDDPNYPQQNGWYPLSLSAVTVCNPAPVAEITVPLASTPCPCNGTAVTSECVENACHAISSPFEVVSSTGGTVTLSGEKSHDLLPGADGQCTVAARAEIDAWTWSLQSKPANSTAASLTTDPTGKSARTTLTFDKTGIYVVKLEVTDKTGLRSPATTFSINVRAAN